MMTSAELQMLRNADSGAVLPGIDTPVGNQVNPTSLKGLSSIPTVWNARPILYNPTTNVVYIVQDGADISGYNFGTATVVVKANGVTIENSTFSATTHYAVQEYAGYTGLTVKNSTFYGGTLTAPWASSTTISGNWFYHAVGDAVDAAGTITGNYFQGGGYSPTIHADAIWVTNSSVPTLIANNLIDWTDNVSDGNRTANNAVRITSELGSVSNVTVENNFLIGGSYTIDAGNGVHGSYTYSNINIANNYIGFGAYGALYPGAMSGVTTSGNVIFDFSNRAYSDQAWAAYKAAGLPNASLVVAAGSVGWTSGAATGSSTVYGNDVAQAHLGAGSANLTNFIGGAGVQYLGGGSTGKNIFTYLAISDSWAGGSDYITNFSPSKDVIDLSHLDANLATSGVQSFKFIGSAPFSSSGGEVRSWYDPTKSVTWVEADLVGGGPNPATDLLIRIVGNVTLTAANFALTPSQSAAAFGSGPSASAGAAGSPTTNAAGPPAQAYYNSTSLVANNVDLGAANNLVLSGNGLTVNRGSGKEILQAPGPKGPSTFTLPYHASETIDASAANAETFVFSSGFGSETIKGLTLTGAAADTIKFAASAFSYLSAGMTQAQDLAAVLAHATSGPSGTTLVDSSGDALFLPGLNASMISASASRFQFV